LGAPYGAGTPWKIRSGILESLRKAQDNLQILQPGWKIKLFDAYRPVAVQTFMVDRELTILAAQEGLNPKKLSDDDRDRLMGKVSRLWAMPNNNPDTPPPHSTGGVFDCTLADASGREVDMGSPIDENSDRSNPDYFAAAKDATGRQAHANRTLLNDILQAEGFRRNPSEWWHFSRGDQLAVWIDIAKAPKAVAIYGRADLLVP